MNETIRFYQDTPHDCSYLDDRQARNIYPDPNKPMTDALYSQLIQHGFRRSGNIAYRPYCLDCNACVAVRINVNAFKASRSQRRCLQRNQTISISHHSASFNAEHFALYQRYLSARHLGGGMDDPTEESYLNFLTSDWGQTSFIEMRRDSELIAVAITDHVDDGLSALYTFFEPDMARYSLGTYSILQQIEIAQTQGLSWLYLGYWIKDCQKMQYKQKFSAIEGYIDQRWQSLEI